MKITVHTLICVADAFLSASEGLREVTLSYRIFGDTKKLAALRSGSEITLGRFNDAMQWFADHWPEGSPRPDALRPYTVAHPAPVTPSEDAA